MPNDQAKAGTILVMFVATWLAVPALAKGRHVHGEGQLDIAIDTPNAPDATAGSQAPLQKLTLQYRLPADALFGFEHEPRNAKERDAMAAALDGARKGAQDWLSLPAALGCGQWEVTVSQPEMPPGKGPGRDAQPATPKRGKKDAAHKDILITVQGSCTKSPAGASVTLTAFEILKSLRVFSVQLLAEGVQTGLRVQRKNPQFKLGETGAQTQP